MSPSPYAVAVRLLRRAPRRLLLRRPVLAAAVALLALAALVLVGRWEIYPRTRVPIESGEAWVASDQIGALTLLDGVAGAAAANVPAGRGAGHALAVGQAGAAGFALDQVTGEVTRVDGATLGADTVLSRRSGRQELFPGTGAVYLVDQGAGQVVTYRAADLVPVGLPVAYGSAGDEYSATVDSAGRLWLLDRGTGRLARYDDAGAHPVDASLPAGSSLASAGGRPAAVDTRAGTAHLLGDAGPTGQRLDLGLSAADGIRVDGAAGADALLLTSGRRGQFETCPFRVGGCDRSVQVPLGSDELGPTIDAYGKVFIPDYTTGGAWLVDPAARTAPAPLALLPGGGRFDLFARNGLVFYNDPRSNRAGTIAADGTVHRIVKYAIGSPSASPTPASTLTPSRTPTPTPAGPRDRTPTAGPTGGGPTTAGPSGSTASPTGSPSPTAIETVTCGETVTHSITLARDLTCSGPGLVVGADRVTVDLGGHTLTGTGGGAGITIGANARITGTVVRNGTISGFEYGVQVGQGGAESVTVRSTTLRDNASGGVWLERVPVHNLTLDAVTASETTGWAVRAFLSLTGTFKVTGSTFSGGIELTGGADLNVTTAMRHDSFNNTSLTFYNVDDATVQDSTFANAWVYDMCSGDGGNTYTGNNFQGAGVGIDVENMARETITDNHFTGNLVGVRVRADADSSTGDVINGNTFTDEGAVGIRVDYDVAASATLVMEGNTVSHSGARAGGDPDPGNNPVRGGIHVYMPHGLATITGNHTSGNTGYGIWGDGAVGSGNTSTGDEHGCLPVTLCA